jgi:hypothetical protein
MRLEGLALGLFVCVKLSAQMPETDIYLAKIEIKNHLIKFEKAENITNHKGYDNQPFFSEDNKQLLYAWEFKPAGNVRTAWYNLKNKKTTSWLGPDTLISAYSPMVGANHLVSFVGVEKDSAQRIWASNQVPSAFCLTPNTDSIGYYSWIGKDSILYYKLTDPHSLRVLNLKTGEDNWLCDHPTRSFKQIEGRTIFYVIHGEKENQIFFYDIRVKKASLFAVDKPDNQDYVWLPEFGMIKSEGPKLFRYSTDTKVWVEAADFSGVGITKITRFAFSPDKKHLAVVSNQ